MKSYKDFLEAYDYNTGDYGGYGGNGAADGPTAPGGYPSAPKDYDVASPKKKFKRPPDNLTKKSKPIVAEDGAAAAAPANSAGNVAGGGDNPQKIVPVFSDMQKRKQKKGAESQAALLKSFRGMLK